MSSSYRSSMRSSTRRGPPTPQSSFKRSSSQRSSSQRSSNQIRTESTTLPGSLRGSTIPPSVVFAQPTSQLPPHVLHGGPKPQPRVLYVPPPPAANAYAAADVARQSYRAGDQYGQNYRSSAPAPAPALVPIDSGDGAADPNRQQSYRTAGAGTNSKRGSFSRESSLKRGRSRSSDREGLSSGGHTVHFIGVPPSTISNRSSAGTYIGVRPHPAFAIGLGAAATLCCLCLCGIPAVVLGCMSLKRTEPLWRSFSRSRMSLVGLILGAVGVLGGVLHVAWWIVFAVVFASGKGPSGNTQLSNYQNQYNAGTCTTDMPDGFNCGWFQSSIYGKMCCCHTSQGSSYACIANNQYVFRTTECFDKCGFNS